MNELALAMAALAISMKQSLTKEECASMLGVSKDAIDGLTNRNQIPYYKCNGHKYFKRTEIEEYVLHARNRVTPETETRAHIQRAVTKRAQKMIGVMP